MIRTSEEILYRLLHDSRFDFGAVEVVYTDRGADGDRTAVSGDEIERIRGGYMEVRSPRGLTTIPLHRLREIRYRGLTVWKHGLPPVDLNHFINERE